MRRIALSLFLAVGVLGNAHAATLSNIQGRVLVNTGNGFVPVTGTAQVNPGDRVQVIGAGTVQIVYDNGCLGTVGANSTVVVLATPPNCNVLGLSNEVIVGGAIVVGGVVAGVVAATQGNSVSP